MTKRIGTKEGCLCFCRRRLLLIVFFLNDWGLYSFVQMLAYKYLHVGKDLYKISERDTTRTCHVCKHKQDMPLWVRQCRCENCGLVMDRDENSAVSIY